ncbi:MAG TPA: hypothetical protein VFY16_03025 [Gemmatimonadaceae bacterium]|nr:hypothetical protein [Gemmatimonadaceae bacterium]
MWALLKSLFAQWVFFRVLLRSLGSLAFLVPLAFLLKAIGWPLLVVLGVLALPVLLVLLLVGLPILLVLVVGGLLLGLVGSVLALGLAAAKVVVPIVAILWLLRWLLRERPGTPPPAPPAPPTPPPPPAPDLGGGI